VDDHRVVSVDPEHADFEQVTVACGTDAHREVVIEPPLRDGVANGVEHVLVSEFVLPGGVRDSHVTRYPCRKGLSTNLVACLMPVPFSIREANRYVLHHHRHHRDTGRVVRDRR